MRKKILSVFLVFFMCLSLLPTGAVTAEVIDNTGLCPHHTEHTEECGYTEAVEGQPCGHEHTDECEYIEDSEGMQCTHVHDETCGYIEAVEGLSCTYEHGAFNVQVETEPEETIETGNNNDTLKTSLLNRIREGSFDPYSSDMTLEEFYALMELFDEGSLPLKNTAVVASSQNSAIMYAGFEAEEPGIEDPGTAVPVAEGDGIIPAKMFNAFYAGSHDPIELPSWWTGFQQGKVFGDDGYVKMVNEGDTDTTAGFPYVSDNNTTHYVRRVTVSGIEASVIGIIDTGDDKVNYYYLTQTDQNTQVSTTALGEGQLFELQYSEEEFSIDYQFELYDKDGNKQTLSEDEEKQWLDQILGEDRPTQTTDRAYLLNATTPYYYTVAIYDTTDGDIKGGTVLGNAKYPLGAEPVYSRSGDSVVAADNYSVVKISDSYSVIAKKNRTVVVQVTRKPDPVFSAQLWLGTNYASGRGTSAAADYEFLKPDGTPNIRPDGDIQTPEDNNWNWASYASGSKNMTWDSETDTWSHSWTFQTNSGDSFLLDSLAVNGVDVDIPFSPAFSGSPNEQAVGMGNPLCCTVATLPDGATVTLEYLYRMNKEQRIYRITVTGAKSNVTVTGGNLMQYDKGAAEFIPQSLSGVKDEIVEYYDGKWNSANKSEPVVSGYFGAEVNNKFSDPDHFGANIRFKLEDGYDEPYYAWEAKSSSVIQDQTSVTEWDEEGNVTTYRPVRKLPESDETLESGYIYGPDQEGYYYIRINTQDNKKVALLSIHALEVRYVLEYLPGDVNAGNMPSFSHTSSHVTLVGKNQIDDNDGAWYDTVTNYNFTISNAIPYDMDASVNKAYEFRGWTVLDNQGNIIYEQAVDEEGEFLYNPDGSPVYAQEEDEDGNPVNKPLMFNGNTLLSLYDFLPYAVRTGSLGGVDLSVSTIRLQAVWKEISNPVSYTVVLNWIDASGDWNEQTFSNWPTVWTTGSEDNTVNLVIQVNEAAELIHDWLAQHPTYSFWDDINNAKDDAAIDAAIKKAFPDDAMRPDVKDFEANGFVRYGNYGFGVQIDEESKSGQVVIWMYENKGGLVFHKSVEQEPFVYEDDFYFTVSDILVGQDSNLNGTYFAYPESVSINDSTSQDAYTVTYKDGNIESIVKGGENLGNYFTLKDGEGIRLYVPPGQYTLTELGSGSGGSYRVEVTYDKGDGNTSDDNVQIPEELSWLQGSATSEIESSRWESEGVKQVSATVKFDAGEDHVIHTLTFKNQTSSLAVQKNIVPVDDAKLLDTDFKFNVRLALPEGSTPLKDNSNNYYYNVNLYDVDGNSRGTTTISLKQDNSGRLEGNNVWTGELTIKGSGQAIIVMQVLEDGINYLVEEIIPSDAEYKLMSDPSQEGHIGTGDLQTAEFTNTRYGSGLTISKTVVGPNASADTNSFRFKVKLTKTENGTEVPVTGTYNVTPSGIVSNDKISFDVNGEATITLTNGQSITIKDLDEGLTAYIEEESIDGYQPLQDYANITIQDKDTPEVVEFYNAELVPLTVKKIVAEELENEKEKEEQEAFTFTVTFTKGTYDLPETVTADKELTKVAGKKNTYTFTLKHNETITFNNLPYDTTYEIIEKESGGYKARLINTKPAGSADNGVNDLDTTTTTGTLDVALDITYYNALSDSETFSLTISKTVAGNMGSRTEAFEFTVKLTDSSGEPVTGSFNISGNPAAPTGNTITFDAEGKAIVKLKHNQSITIEGIDKDTVYEVVETDNTYETTFTQTGVLTAGSGKTATGALDNDITVAYINTRTAGIPTNATTQYGWLIPIFLISFAGITALLIKQRRGLRYGTADARSKQKGGRSP